MVRLAAFGVVLLVVAAGVGAVASAGAAVPQPSDATPESATDADRQFAFNIQEISNCGFTCRDVTITATNTANTSAENVTVSTRLEAGQRVVWQGNESVEALGPGESTTVTKRVTVGYFDALWVLRNDGQVTANTTVAWESGSESFTERRKVT